MTVRCAVLVLLAASARAQQPTVRVPMDADGHRVDSPGTYFGAIIGQKVDKTAMEIYVSIGTSRTYVHEEQTTKFSTVSVAFDKRIESVRALVEGLDFFIGKNHQFVGFTKVGPEVPQFATGRIATVTFAEADLPNARIDYASPETSIEVLPNLPAVRFDADAVVLLSGEGAKRDLSVYARDKGIRAVTLGFNDVTDYVSPAGSVTTDSKVAVQAFVNSRHSQIAMASFADPYLVPTEMTVAHLTFTLPVDMSRIDTAKCAVEGQEYEHRGVVVIDWGRSFLSACSAQEREGDFNGGNGFTLGDAIYVAQMWSREVPVTDCYGGDFNQKNGFTLGDAIFVAQVWARQERFPWHSDGGSRQLKSTANDDVYTGTVVAKKTGATTMDILVSIGASQTTRFSTASVAFTHRIVSVQVHVNGMDYFIDSVDQKFVGFTKVQPDPPRFATGRIATVTFAEADMPNVGVDYGSARTSIEVLPSLPAVRLEAPL